MKNPSRRDYVAMGRAGGLSRSAAKRDAVRANGALGGRPRKKTADPTKKKHAKKS